MKWAVAMKVKDYARNWSNQYIKTDYRDVSIVVEIQDRQCFISLEGDGNIEKVFYLVWELLFLYDGYFYKIQKWSVDGVQKDAKSLYRLPLYKTNKKWMASELLGRSCRDLSNNVINKYDVFRNTGMADEKMTKAVVNSFYYLHSEAYEKINADHLLSLLLNVADGFVINTYKDTNDVKANLDRIFKRTISLKRLQYGISLLGMNGELYKYNLAQERIMFDHYDYKEDSVATFIYNSKERKADFIKWYFIYIMELVLRINFLKEIRVNVNQEVMDYALESINDWIIYENDMDVECTTPHYQVKQSLKKAGIVMR